MSSLRVFDGHLVESFSARFGTFDIDDEDAEKYVTDRELVLVALVTVDGASYKRLTSGDWKRSNLLRLNSLRVVEGEMRETLVDVFHLEEGEQQRFSFPAMEEEDEEPGAPEEVQENRFERSTSVVESPISGSGAGSSSNGHAHPPLPAPTPADFFDEKPPSTGILRTSL